MIRPASHAIGLLHFGAAPAPLMIVRASGNVGTEDAEQTSSTPRPSATDSAILTDERIDLVVQMSGLAFGAILGAAAARS